MRKIRFRGKRCDNGEWVYGSLLQHYKEGVAFIEWKGRALGENLGVIPDHDFSYEVDPETVGQFTGFRDKGQAIYEGDILKTRCYEHHQKDGERVLKYEQFCNDEVVFDRYTIYNDCGVEDPHYGWCCSGHSLPLVLTGWLHSNTYFECLGIIGNIHDNPELKKEDK